MKKQTLVLFGILFIILSSKAQEYKNDLSKENLIGKVKSFRAIPFEAKEKQGKITKGEIVIYGTGIPYSYVKYDEKGNKKEENQYKPDGNLSYRTTFNHNKIGYVIERLMYYPDGSLDAREVYSYDIKGHDIKDTVFMNDGQIESSTTQIYNEKGNKIKSINYDPNGKSWYLSTSEYDEFGKMIRNNQFGNGDDKLTGWNIYKYDENGKMIEINCYKSDGSLDYRCIYKYDKRGNLIEEKTYKNTSLLFHYTYKYELDNQGNWIKQIKYDNDNPKLIIERIIEYYN